MNHNDVDFYGTLVDAGKEIWELANCSDSEYKYDEVYKGDEIGFGVKRCDYYTLATDEAKCLRWSDGSSAEGEIRMCDEEDSEESIKYKRERDSLIKDVEQQRELLKDFSRFIHRKVEACPGKKEYMDFRDRLNELGIGERK